MTAMKAAIDDLGPFFERTSGHTLRITAGAARVLAKASPTARRSIW